MKSSNEMIVTNNKIEHKFVHVKNQFIAVLCVNIITLSHGCGVGWLSPTILIILSDDSIFGPITTEQVSWLVAIISFGGMCGNIVSSILNKYFGRKIGLLLLAFPYIIYWICVMICRDINYLYAARFLAGFTGGGTLICIPMFVAEVASDHVRGNLGYYYVLSFNVGVLFAYVVGFFLPYHIVPYVHISFPVIFFIGVLFLPDTPIYLLQNGMVEAAEKSLRFYSNCKKDRKNDNERFTHEYEKLKCFVQKRVDENTFQLKDIFEPQALRGILLGIVLVTQNILCGSFILIFYAGSIFKDSGSKLDPNISSIIMMSVQLAGTYTATFCVDRCGRRIVMMVSTFGTFAGLSMLAIFIYLSSRGFDLLAFNLVPVISCSIAVFSLSLGIVPLTFVILAEVLPNKIRSFASTFCMLFFSILLFSVSKVFPMFTEMIGLHSCIFIFATVCAIGFIFALTVLPETKGKSLNN